MKQKIKKLNLRGKGLVRINRSGCLDRCASGPLLVIYPDAVWYTLLMKAILMRLLNLTL